MKLFWHQLSSWWFAMMVPVYGPLSTIDVRETVRKRRLFSSILLIAFLAAFLFTIQDVLSHVTLLQDIESMIGWWVPLGALWINRRGYLKCASMFYLLLTLLTAFTSIYFLSLKTPVFSLYFWPVLLLLPVCSGLFLPAWGPFLLCMLETGFMYWFVQYGSRSQIALYIHDPQSQMQFLFLACILIFLAAIFSAIYTITTKKAVIQADRAVELEHAYTELETAHATIQKQALTDTLTGLPNRSLLWTRIELVPPSGDYCKAALLVLDLDRFKEVNDTFGHQLGDQLLRLVGERLCQSVDPAVTVSRIGGDEFAVFLPITDETTTLQVVEQLNTTLEEPFTIGEHLFSIEASTGIALYPVHGNDPLTLCRHADVAMHLAKKNPEKYAFYDVGHDPYNAHRLTLLAGLRKAIAKSELRLYYQPKAELQTGLVKEVEALVRWQHPTEGFIAPDQFIPLAEQTGLITPLTRWVVETAIRQCREWLDVGRELCVAVNLSMRNLRDASLPDAIADLLTQYRVPSRLFCCEVTESAVMTDAQETLHVLSSLRAMGVRIAIDDYGTGYASLSYLKQIPANELKIDRAFVQYLTINQADQAIVRSTVSMAHSLGMQVVAEGVEDQATWNLLASFECDIAQGYYLSRPIPPLDLIRWLDARQEESRVAIAVGPTWGSAT
jgi:diguanylate cyclase (GGDEF)-like protein